MGITTIIKRMYIGSVSPIYSSVKKREVKLGEVIAFTEEEAKTLSPNWVNPDRKKVKAEEIMEKTKKIISRPVSKIKRKRNRKYKSRK